MSVMTKGEILNSYELSSPRLLEKALGIRLFGQRLLKLFSEGRLFGTVHTCIGQEWSGAFGRLSFS